LSLMNCQMMRVISSPSISTTGVATLILFMSAGPSMDAEKMSRRRRGGARRAGQ
jgi:hypothetical protein